MTDAENENVSEGLGRLCAGDQGLGEKNSSESNIYDAGRIQEEKGSREAEEKAVTDARQVYEQSIYLDKYAVLEENVKR